MVKVIKFLLNLAQLLKDLLASVAALVPRRSPKATENSPPGLPAPGDDKTTCPICGWSPCTQQCTLGLSKYEVDRLREEFRENYDGDEHEGESRAA